VQLDLAAEVIHRGRDHGLPDYNTLRTAYGLQKVKYVVVDLLMSKEWGGFIYNAPSKDRVLVLYWCCIGAAAARSPGTLPA
jgi:hypothetical protein